MPRSWTVAGVGVGLLALLAVAGRGAPVTPAPTPTPDHASQAGYPYPASVEASFKRGFADSPGMGDCALRETERRYSYDDFVSISRAYGGTGTLPPSLRAIVLSCAQSLQ